MNPRKRTAPAAAFLGLACTAATLHADVTLPAFPFRTDDWTDPMAEGLMLPGAK